MTFRSGEYEYGNKEYPMFTLWEADKGILFPPLDAGNDQDECYELSSKVYVLMKRLKQDYRTILMMPVDERDELFRMELEVMKKEEESTKKNDT